MAGGGSSPSVSLCGSETELPGTGCLLPSDRTIKAAFTTVELELATPKSQVLLKVQALLMFWPKKKIEGVMF